jgi:hypothetical protein
MGSGAAGMMANKRLENHPTTTTTAYSRQYYDTPDGELVSELRSLVKLIQKHVESNYHLESLDTADIDRDGIAKSLNGVSRMQHDSQFLLQLCLNPATRHVAICHIICAALFPAIDFREVQDEKNSLLPPAIAVFRRSMPRSKQWGDQSPQGKKKFLPTNF